MTILLKEMSHQHANQAQELLHRRRKGKLLLIGFIYLAMAMSGAGVGAVSAGGESTRLIAIGAGVIAPLSLVAATFMFFNIRRATRAINTSLDVIAAMRGMAYESNRSGEEYLQLTNDYRSLMTEYSRKLFEKRTASIRRS